MALVELDFSPARRELRLFGIALAVVLASLGALLLWRHHLLWIGFSPGAARTAAVVLLPLAGASLALALARPHALRWLFVGLCIIAWPIGTAVSIVLLAILFYGVLTPIGLLRRWLGADPMGLRFDRNAPTYWMTRSPAPPKQRYFRQW